MCWGGNRIARSLESGKHARHEKRRKPWARFYRNEKDWDQIIWFFYTLYWREVAKNVRLPLTWDRWNMAARKVEEGSRCADFHGNYLRLLETAYKAILSPGLQDMNK